MKSTLYLKFIIIYIVFGFMSIFIVATLTTGLTTSLLKKDTASSMYQDATLIANNYLSKYYSDKVTTSAVQLQLSSISTQFHASVWFVDKDGEMITSACADTYPQVPNEIKDFNPAEVGGDQYLTGTYHDYFEDDVITIIAPVVYGYSPKGYLLIHKHEADLVNTQSIYTEVAYISLVVIYLLSFSILAGVHYLIYRPLRKITEAATQYASGNLDYEIPVNTQDEIGYLSASLNYMSSQLKDMEDYQKKFVANVSHDFRSPLTSIKGYVEAMADGTIPPELYPKYLKIILFETERLTDLTQDLLTLNEFDTKNLLLNRENFDIHEMIKNVASTFEGICVEKKISIELLFASKQLIVYADKRKIQQVVYNLLDNAIKFSDPDSTITIETNTRGDKVYTSVKDYGIGIPRNALNKIWERFYKTDLSRGKDKKGTGLGLAIVKEAIQAHGENINVISTEGVGTEFIFSLPKK
mgnify:FL=1